MFYTLFSNYLPLLYPFFVVAITIYYRTDIHLLQRLCQTIACQQTKEADDQTTYYI